MADLSLARAAPRSAFRRPSRNLTPYALVAPVVLVLTVLLAYPLVIGLYTSMTNLRVGRWQTAQFIGLANYSRILAGGDFYHALQVTLTFGAMCIAVEMPLGLGLALLLNRELPGIGVFRAICLIPIMVPNVVSALMWRTMMDPQGVLNYLLAPFGFTKFLWLPIPQTFRFA